ncbi:TVP38/TMEM64 family protein [Sporobolomyces koalae]|uniref:TVP38/TMEM64 family protein n=1 Tax=Sporobolomyces koalae TaxID=500713 RepID=UPI0031764C3C
MSRVHAVLERTSAVYQRALDYYESLNPRAKLLLWLWVALHVVGAVAFWWIGWENIFAWMAQLADNVRKLEYGWLILGSIVVVTSLPPLVGYGTAQTLIGFAYGVSPGFFISAGSCLVGGVFAFLVIRRLLRFFAPFIHKDQTFQALSNAVRVKGLPLIILLRLCPFPYPYSNAFFASVESVSLSQFFLATLTITPKLLLHVFIGHRTYLFADPESRHKMDPLSRYINFGFMIVGSLLGIGTSWYLYRVTMRFVDEAERERIGLGVVDLEEGGGLLGQVEEFLESDDRQDPRQTSLDQIQSQGTGRTRKGSIRLVDVPEDRGEDQWSQDGDFSDFEHEQELIVERERANRSIDKDQALVDLDEDEPAPRVGQNAQAGGAGPRRDSEAWGFDVDDEEELDPAPAVSAKGRID